MSDRRAVVLARLRQHATLPVADLADEVAAVEHDTTLDRVAATAVRDTYLDLHADTLPALERAGEVVVDHDHDLASLAGYGADAPVPVERVRATPWFDRAAADAEASR